MNNAQHYAVSKRIRDWFQGERENQGWERSLETADEVNAMIASMSEPLPESAAAWKQWIDFENNTSKKDPGLHVAMNLCKYAEWAADAALGLSKEPFVGVPCLIIRR
jgi:hypothetical protein